MKNGFKWCCARRHIHRVKDGRRAAGCQAPRGFHVKLNTMFFWFQVYLDWMARGLGVGVMPARLGFPVAMRRAWCSRWKESAA